MFPNVIIYNLFVILFNLFLLCSLILSFCTTIFNLFFTLSFCNIYLYFVIRYYHIVFDIFKMLSLFLLCVFIISFLSITTYYYLTNTSRAMTIIAILCVCSCSVRTCLKNDNIATPWPKAKNFYFCYNVHGTCVTMPSRLCDMFYEAYMR